MTDWMPPLHWLATICFYEDASFFTVLVKNKAGYSYL
jgi:hypothetical protein